MSAMICVYQASSGLEAHMILNMLNNEGIDGHIEGEHLQGAAGELPAMGLVRVVTDESDYDKARKIIAEWEAAQPPLEVSKRQTESQKTAMAIFVVGFVSGMVFAFLLIDLLNP